MQALQVLQWLGSACRVLDLFVLLRRSSHDDGTASSLYAGALEASSDRTERNTPASPSRVVSIDVPLTERRLALPIGNLFPALPMEARIDCRGAFAPVPPPPPPP